MTNNRLLVTRFAENAILYKIMLICKIAEGVLVWHRQGKTVQQEERKEQPIHVVILEKVNLWMWQSEMKLF